MAQPLSCYRAECWLSCIRCRYQPQSQDTTEGLAIGSPLYRVTLLLQPLSDSTLSFHPVCQVNFAPACSHNFISVISQEPDDFQLFWSMCASPLEISPTLFDQNEARVFVKDSFPCLTSLYCTSVDLPEGIHFSG